jgi:Ras GTPase-activating-like protein IQGAP2/3
MSISFLFPSFIPQTPQEYNSYLEDVLQSFYQQPTRKKDKGGKKGDQAKIGPFKFTYNELTKQGVLLDSEVPQLSRKKVCFFFFFF